MRFTLLLLPSFRTGSARFLPLLLYRVNCLPLLACLCLLPSCLWAQNYHIDTWRVEDGLPQNSVNSIIQTRDGYLWLGTNGGLVRFDGERFQLYDMHNTPELSNNRIMHLYEDRQQRLWIATAREGLLRHDRKTIRNVAEEMGLGQVAVQKIREDAAGNLWVATTNAGCFRFSPTGDGSHFSLPEGLLEEWVSDLAVAPDGNVWVVNHGRLQVIRGGRVYPSPLDGLLRPFDRVEAVLADSSGTVWVGVKNGLYRYRGGSLSFHRLTGKTGQDLTINVLALDKMGQIWAGTNGGLFRLSEGVETALAPEEGLSENHVWAVLQDNESNLWVGTNAGGLCRMKPNLFSPVAGHDRLPNTSMLAVYEDRDGALWLGASCEGLYRVQKGQVTHFGEKQGLTNTCVWAIQEDAGGSLWVGTAGGGLFRLAAGRFVPAEGPATVGVLFSDSRRNLWVGSYEGLFCIRDHKLVPHPYQATLFDVGVSFLHEDPDGTLWVSTNKGLYELRDGQARAYGSAQGLTNPFLRGSYREKSGDLWLGTYGGGLMHFKDGRFTPITVQHGLSENVVSYLVEDEANNLWMTGNKGISRVSLRDLHLFLEGKIKRLNCVQYNQEDGLKSSEFNGGFQQSGCRTRDGDYVFPTINGAVRVDINRNRPNPLPPPVYIESVTLADQPVPFGASAQFPYSESRIEFRFTALSFVSSKNVQFKYQLEGYDPQWIDAGKERRAYYTKVPPGEYVFRVKASNNDGIWNETGAAVTLVVLAPYYMTWWFRTLVGLTAAGILLLAYGLHLRRLNRQQLDKLQAMVTAQEQERKRIAEDLHDGVGQLLTAVKLNLSLLKETSPDPAPDRQQLQQQLLGSTQSYVDHVTKELRTIAYNLMPSTLGEFGLLAAIEEQVSKISASNQVKIRFLQHTGHESFPQPVEMCLFRVFQELTNNAIRHADATEITVQVVEHEADLLLMVEDDGSGIFPEADGAAGPGRGLKNIQTRVQALSGRITIDASPGVGTTVSVEIPLAPDRLTRTALEEKMNT